MQTNQSDCFQLKADFIPMTVLKLTSTNITDLKKQITATINKAPNYFHNAPVIIDTSDIASKDLDITLLHELLKNQHIMPIGIRGLAKSLHDRAREIGLAILNAEVKKPTETSAEKAKTSPPTSSASKVITKPVRSGTQVYAKNADLVILSAVNPGAECIADGNIHIYGPLRGRALAGANGNTSAFIFCKKLEAELIAIAGHYQVKENIQEPKHQDAMIQISLQDQKLRIQPI